MGKILIAHCNPHPVMVAAAVDLIRKESASTVDCLNLVKLTGQIHPDQGIRDRLYECIDRKFERFIRKHVNGADITPELRADVSIPPVPKRIDELRAYSIGQSRIGLATLSTAASFARCNSDLTKDYGPHIERSWVVAHKSYVIADQVKRTRQYDKIYIYNGRHDISKPFADHMEGACKVLFYEYGSKRNMYELYEDRIHSTSYMARLINSHVSDLKCGARFFEDRNSRPGWGTDFQNVLSIQTLNHTPDEVRTKPYIAFFTSSPDELFATNDTSGFGPFASQFELALAAAQASQKSGKAFVLRLHPHLRVKHASWKTEWDFDVLADHGAIIVFPDSSVDSHALMGRAAGVISAGSSMSLDAAYMGIPNIVAGDVVFDKIGCSLALRAVADLERFVEGPSLIEGAKDAALRYGSYIETYGIVVRGLEFTEHGDARMDGRFISPSQMAVGMIKRNWSNAKWVRRNRQAPI